MPTIDVLLPKKFSKTPLSQIGQTLLARIRDWPHPELSVEILKTLHFPHDEEGRNAFLAAFNLRFGLASPPRTTWGLPNWVGAGEYFLDLLDPQSVKTQLAWASVGELLVNLVAINDCRDTRLRSGASLWKAVALLESVSGNRHSLVANWKQFKDVAHVAAAAQRLVVIAHQQVGPDPDLNLMSAITADPISVLSGARAFQEFGLSVSPHGREETFLSPATIWRVPDDFKPPSIAGYLSEGEISVIVNAANARRFKRKRQAG